MLKLIFSDLRANKATWVGAFLVAMTCGYIGGWVVSILATAQFYTDSVYRNVNQAGTILFLFSVVAGLTVIAAVANLTVAAQRRSYALWQLVNV
ncbi:MAG TPA: ABC transporter permease, partial [Atopobiaceae bacterium]|nr:ABC transporter permease [Atopobiaceae bacterium]